MREDKNRNEIKRINVESITNIKVSTNYLQFKSYIINI